MTKIIAAKETVLNYDNLSFKIRNTEEFEIETFSLPSRQKFPTDHYEVKTFSIVGPIGCGKSTLAIEYYGNRIREIWGNEADFYLAKDLWATIEAVKSSKRLVHYLIIDDSIPMFDSRRSMSSSNVDMTQMFYEIRHELKKHAKLNQGNAGGLVIICLITQDFMAIDRRIRKALAFTVFKAYDESCEKLIEDNSIIKTLKRIKDKTVRVCDYFYRQLAVAVDAEENYTLFFADRSTLDKIDFKYVTGEDIFEQQQNYFIEYLVENFDLQDVNKDQLKAELHFEIDRLKKENINTRINKSDFSEIIIRATRLQEIKREVETQKSIQELAKIKEKERYLFYLQFHRLINHFVKNLNIKDLTKSDLEAELLFEIDRITQKTRCFIKKRHFREIIIRATRLQKLIYKKLKKADDIEEFQTDRTDGLSILILHDTLGKSFREIADIKGISNSTAHDRYMREKEIQQNALQALLNKEIEMSQA